jgi:hypothetical protein
LNLERFQELDYPDVSANSVVMAGSGPAMTGDRKFANVFKVSSAGGNIRVIRVQEKCMRFFARKA